MIVAIIPAAGESKRMKSPKALLKIGKESFVQCIVRKLHECGLDFVFVITGPHHDLIQKEVPQIEVCFNARHQEGQLSSLKEGLRNLPTGATETLIWPVDHPLVRTETVHLLMDTYHNAKKRLTIPVFETHRGHPVLYDRFAIQTILTLNNATQTAKDLQTIYESETTLLEVEDPGVLIDIDTPEDYTKHITNAGL